MLWTMRSREHVPRSPTYSPWFPSLYVHLNATERDILSPWTGRMAFIPAKRPVLSRRDTWRAGHLSVQLHRNPLHDIPADLALAPVVEIGGARIGVPGQVLHVLARDVLLQQIGDGRDAEGVGGVEQGHREVF